MPPRRQGKGPHARTAGSSPTPIESALTTPITTTTTPLSPAYPSAYPSEIEWDTDDVANLPIGALTLDVPLANKPPLPKKKRATPFRFMGLPSELRLKIYGFHFAGLDQVVDMEHGNYFTYHKKLMILRVCRQIYREASHYFYGTFTFRIFPIDGRYSRSKKTVLSRMKPKSRVHITTLELRVGPGFNKPYRSWVVNPQLGLQDCLAARNVNVFIEVDPSNDIFKGFRRADGFYENFCCELLDSVLKELPHVTSVQFDANSSVKKSGDMTQGLLDVARDHNKTICWGPEKGWTDEDVEEEDEPLGPTTAIDWGYATPTGLTMAADVQVLA